MAVVISASTGEPRAFSIGPVRVELHEVTVASGDTEIACTASSLHRVDFAILTLDQESAVSLADNVATFTVVDDVPRAGQIILFGR